MSKMALLSAVVMESQFHLTRTFACGLYLFFAVYLELTTNVNLYLNTQQSSRWLI